MIPLLLASGAAFISGEADFAGMSAGAPNYLVGRLQLASERKLDLDGVYLDCRGFAVESRRQLFGALSGVTLLNCDFMMETFFADSIDRSEFVNVTITYMADTVAPLVGAAVQDSAFVGMKIWANDPFSLVSRRNTYAGCTVKNYLNQDGDIAGLAQSSEGDRVTNSIVVFNGVARVAQSVGGLFLRSEATLIQRSRLVVSVSQTLSDRTSIGGVAANASGLVILDSDIIVSIAIGDMDGFIGGIVGCTSGPGLRIENASLVVQMALNTTDSSSEIYAVGGVAGFCAQDGTAINSTSVFADIELNSTQTQRTLVGGVVGDFDAPGANSISETHLFLAGKMDSTSNFVFGGIVGEGAEIAVGRCSVSMDAALRVGGNSSVGGIVGINQAGGAVSDSQAIGSVTCSFLPTDEGALGFGGIAARLNGTLVQYCYAGLLVVVARAPEGVQGQIRVGLLLGQMDGNSSLAGSFGAGSLQVDAGGSLADGYVGLLAALCNGSSISEAFVLGALNVAAGHERLAVGTVAGAAIGSNVSDVFVRGEFVLEGAARAGSIAGQTDAPSFRNMYLEVKVSSPDPLLPHGGADDAAIDQKTVRIDCEAGNHGVSAVCSTAGELKEDEILGAIGDRFVLVLGANGGFPVLRGIPAPTASGFALPAEGHFTAEAYFVDAKGLPFPLSDFSICRGACYGEFESPASFECDPDVGAPADQHCISYSQALSDFPYASCFQANGWCVAGQSGCDASSELVGLECERTCPDCTNGYCSGGACVCNPYYVTASCFLFQCDAVEPVCYGYPHLACSPTNECDCDDAQYFLQEGQCVFGCPGLLASHGRCIGEGKAACAGNWVSALGLCDECAPDFFEQDGLCVSKNTTCYEGRCLNGRCQTRPAAHCVCDNYWTGARCDVCDDFGEYCHIKQGDCDARFCSGHGVCSGRLAGFTCECRPNFDSSRNCSQCAAGYYRSGDDCAGVSAVLIVTFVVAGLAVAAIIAVGVWYFISARRAK